MQAYLNTCIPTYIHTYMYILHAFTHTRISAAHTHKYTVGVQIYIHSMYICVYVCIYVCMYVYTWTHIHTYKHINTKRLFFLKGTGSEKKSTFFKELTPRSRTYELRGQGEIKAYTESKTDKHLALSYKNYLQKRAVPP